MDATASGTKKAPFSASAEADADAATAASVSRRDPPAPEREAAGFGHDVMPLMELLFFAYRDFIAEPDAMLAELGFGRAHHRVLHFIGRHPGLRVSELLAILRITKQSLGRVLRELLERGYVVQEEGTTDRRQRLLHLTPAGQRLLERLEAPQIARVRAALADAGDGARETFAHMLLGLVDEADRHHVAALCGLPHSATSRKTATGSGEETSVTEGGDGRGAPCADRG